jgi:hypothetical protein
MEPSHKKDNKKRKHKGSKKRKKRKKHQKSSFATKEARAAGRAFTAIEQYVGTSTDCASTAALRDLRYRLSRLLHMGIDPAMVVDRSGRTLLHRAVLHNNVEVCSLLINTLGDDMVNLIAGSEDASTALHYACLNKNAAICHLLWKHGADTGIKNALGMTVDEMGFVALVSEGERQIKERERKDAEWHSLDQLMKRKRERDNELCKEEGAQVTSEEEEIEDKGEEKRHENEDESDGGIQDGNGEKPLGDHEAKESNLSFERWKKMENRKWCWEKEELDWKERLADEWASECNLSNEEWASHGPEMNAHMPEDEEKWKDWVWREMAHRASQRWGQDHADFYDASARKQREKANAEREREKERETKEKIEREEAERELQRRKVEDEQREQDWRRLESAWTAFEAKLCAPRENTAEIHDIGLMDIPFPDIEKDEQNGHTLGGFNFLAVDVSEETKAKFLRTVFLRWHPDKFEQRVGQRLKHEDKLKAMALVTRITQHITALKSLLSVRISKET